MRKLTFRRIRGIGSFEIDLEHLTVIAGDDEVGKEALMTSMYEMIGSASDVHADGASMEVEGFPGVSGAILYDTPLVIRGVFAGGCDHRSELWDMLMDDRPDVHPLDEEPEGYRMVMGRMCPGNLEP